VGRQQRGAARQALLDARRRGLTDLQAAVLAWYRQGRRDLPWRRTRDPYAILVSEVMLQQTQVARVVPRYEAWLERWPDAAALAAATPAEVLTEWVGLGYNRRALRLREACLVVARDGWPADAAGLRALPGIGPYTAAAVASFAFGEQVPAADTNVARVAGRLGRTPQELLPDGEAATWNQAAMELGAMVCGARRVACDVCPAEPWCPSAGQVVVAPRAAKGSRPRFEDTDRFARGRVVAALAAGSPLPADLGAERLDRALVALSRDGLVVRDADGTVRLPG
jgi:A/G-specific adenine glycosylase